MGAGIPTVLLGRARKAVAVPGTAERLSTGTLSAGLTAKGPITRVDLQAFGTTGVTVGGPEDVDGVVATRNGIFIAPGEIYPMAVGQLDQVWIDPDTANDGVTALVYG